MGRCMIMPANIRSCYDAATLFYLEVIMGNLFKYSSYNWMNKQLEEHYIEDQPEFTMWLGQNNEEKIDGKYTSLYGAQIDESNLPMNTYLPYYNANAILVEGDNNKLNLFRLPGTLQYFKDKTSDENKLIYHYQYDPEDTFPLKIFETDTTEIYIDSLVFNTDSRINKVYKLAEYEYTDPVTGDVSTIVGYRPYEPVYSNYVKSVNIRTVDKITNSSTVKEYFIKSPMGSPFFGAENFSVVISLLIFNDFNPMYTASSVNSSNYVRDLNNKGKLLQHINNVTDYYSETGTIGVPFITVVTDTVYFNYTYDYFESPMFINNNQVIYTDWLQEHLFDDVYGIKAGTADYPSAQVDYQYYEKSTDLRFPEGWYGTFSSNTYISNVPYTLTDFLLLTTKQDDGSYLISSLVANYNEPRPEPEPDPGEDPNNYEPGINVPEVEDPGETPPTPELPKKDDLYDRLTEYIDGKLGKDNIKEEEETPSDEVQPYDGRMNRTMIDQMGSNWSIYFGNLDTIASLRTDICNLEESYLDRAILLLDKTFQPSQVISKVLQFPFSTTYIVNQINNYGGVIEQAVPCHKNIPLCGGITEISSSDENYLSILLSNLSAVNGEYLDGVAQKNILSTIVGFIKANVYNATVLTQVATCSPLLTNTCNTYPRVTKRFVPIDYGFKTIKRIFGNYLDFTEVNYRLLLPTGVTVQLDPQLLFRNSDGSESNECILEIKGMLDLETGDVLMTITANDDMIAQTTVNVAIERSLYGQDNVQAIRAIVSAIGDMTKAIALNQFPATRYDLDPGQTWTKKPGDVKVYDEHGVQKFKQEADENVSKRGSSLHTTKYYPTQEQIMEFMVNGILKQSTAWQGSPTVSLSEFNSQGSTKIISNQLPVLIYDYPEIIMPHRQTDSYSSAWDFNFNYQDEYGLPACTYNVGMGYNRYNSISKIDFTWSYSWSYDEYAGFADSLLEGFYVMHNNYIHVEPSAYNDLFKKHQHGEAQSKGAYLGPEVTNWISLFNISGSDAKYLDKYFHKAYHVQDNVDFWDCYRCQIYRDQDIAAPIIDIDQKIYYHQNSVQWCGRFYKVSKVEYLTGHIVRLYLKEDFLSSWFWAARVVGLIDRSSAYGINNMQDNLPHTARRITKKIVYDDIKPYLGLSLAALSANPYMKDTDIPSHHSTMTIVTHSAT